MAYENFYPGSVYPLDPEYGELFTGYRVSAERIGMTTDPRTANQLQEVSNKINPGGKVIEVSTISPQIFEAVPDQHLKAIKQLSKITGTEISVHGPAIEPSGYTREGKWSEADRKQAENQILSAIERSHKLDSKGNIPVSFHSAYMIPEERVIIKEEGKEKPKTMLATDTRTGEIIQIKETEKYFPEEGGLKKEFDPLGELKKRNDERWIQTLNNLNWYAMRGEENIRAAIERIEKEGGKEVTEEILRAYAEEGKEKVMEKFAKEGIPTEDLTNTFRNLDHGSIFLRDSYNMLRELYNRVYKEATPEDRAKLNAYNNLIKKEVEAGIEKDPEKLERFAELVEKGVNTLKDIKSPNLFQPLNKFLIDKNSETFANTALAAYKKFGDKAPIISIENPPAGTALSRAGEIKELIEKSWKKFIEKAKKEGMSEGQARDVAKKLIGATWDVGHINMLRKYGYDKADIVKETGKIAPYVKHIHLSDNFGYEHTELPMGMGTVPIKEIMEKLGKKSEEVKKIVEAGQWYQFFKTPPLIETYEAFGSSLFQMKAPYWNQIASTYGAYSAGYGTILPEQHFSLYGGGFSTLPTELGGQMPGKQTRFGGTPTA
jgi:hypothetical protein